MFRTCGPILILSRVDDCPPPPIDSRASHSAPTSPQSSSTLYPTVALFAISPRTLDGFSQTEFSTASPPYPLSIYEEISHVALRVLPLSPLHRRPPLFHYPHQSPSPTRPAMRSFAAGASQNYGPTLLWLGVISLSPYSL